MILVCGFIWIRFQVQDKKVKSEHSVAFAKLKTELTTLEIQNLQTLKANRRAYAYGALAVIVFSIWIGAWRPHQIGLEKEKQHQMFLSAYSEGWDFYCHEIFGDPSSGLSSSSISPNGLLYAGNYSYNFAWCSDLRKSSFDENAYKKDYGWWDASASNLTSSRSEGLNAGVTEAYVKVFQQTPYLCYGAQCISKETEMQRMAG